jgi:hypothetical protein
MTNPPLSLFVEHKWVLLFPPSERSEARTAEYWTPERKW